MVEKSPSLSLSISVSFCLCPVHLRVWSGFFCCFFELLQVLLLEFFLIKLKICQCLSRA